MRTVSATVPRMILSTRSTDYNSFPFAVTSVVTAFSHSFSELNTFRWLLNKDFFYNFHTW